MGSTRHNSFVAVGNEEEGDYPEGRPSSSKRMGKQEEFHIPFNREVPHAGTFSPNTRHAFAENRTRRHQNFMGSLNFLPTGLSQMNAPWVLGFGSWG